MRLASSIAGPRTIDQILVAASVTIPPNTAFTDLLRLDPVNIHGQPVRVTATGSCTLTGTTNTGRAVFFQLTHGAGNTVLCGGAFALATDEAATSLSTFFALNFIILAPPVLATDQFALRWSTLANSTANVNGTTTIEGARLNVEELTSASAVVGPTIGELFFVTRQANDPQSLLTEIQQSFVNALVVSSNVQLVDIVVSGGGAGQVYLAEICFRVPVVVDTAYPLVSGLAVSIAFGPDWTTNTTTLNRLVLAQPGGVLEFWANGCGGDGAYWLTILVHTPDQNPPGPGLLVLRASDIGAPAIRKTTVATSKGPVSVFTARPVTIAPYRMPPPPGKPPVVR